MWTKTKYPDAMKKLPDEIRNKAISIANARLEEDVDGNQKALIDTSIRLAEASIKNRRKKTGTIVERKTKNFLKLKNQVEGI